MFSASKLYQSLSTCGPSATENPRSAKIATISSVTWLTGWIDPSATGRAASVTSAHSPATRAASAASPSRAFAAASAAPSSSFSAFSAGPAACRSSGLIAPSPRISSDTSPFLPSAATRTASSPASSPAAAISPRYRSLRPAIPSMIPRPRRISPRALTQSFPFWQVHAPPTGSRLGNGRHYNTIVRSTPGPSHRYLPIWKARTRSPGSPDRPTTPGSPFGARRSLSKKNALGRSNEKRPLACETPRTVAYGNRRRPNENTN